MSDSTDQLSPQRIMQMTWGFAAPLTLEAAVRHRVFDTLDERPKTLEEIANSEGVVPSYATRLFRLTLLAPDIVSAILSGRHPPELTARRLMDDTRLPLEWQDQRQLLGFNAPL